MSSGKPGFTRKPSGSGVRTREEEDNRELLVEGGGVYAPEACLDPQTFIVRFVAKGISAYVDLAMTQPLA